jgi:hypothetical protein
MNATFPPALRSVGSTGNTTLVPTSADTQTGQARPVLPDALRSSRDLPPYFGKTAVRNIRARPCGDANWTGDLSPALWTRCSPGELDCGRYYQPLWVFPKCIPGLFAQRLIEPARFRLTIIERESPGGPWCSRGTWHSLGAMRVAHLGRLKQFPTALVRLPLQRATSCKALSVGGRSPSSK